MNIEHASLVLKPHILTVNTTNTYGTCNAGRSVYTFTRINLRNVLGSLYDKYTKFNLILKNVMCEAVNTWGTAAQDQAVTINIGGLNFINNYEVITKTGTQQSTLTSLLFNTSGSLSVSYNNNCAATFITNGVENVDLTISYQRISDGTTPAGTFGKVLFIFDIVPIVDK
jgi:hypothetical protein